MIFKTKVKDYQHYNNFSLNLLCYSQRFGYDWRYLLSSKICSTGLIYINKGHRLLYLNLYIKLGDKWYNVLLYSMEKDITSMKKSTRTA